MKKNVLVVLILALVIGLVLYMNRTAEETVEVVIEDEQVVTKELVANQTAASLTITVDDHISLDGAILFATDSVDLSDDGKDIINERIAKYRGKVENNLDIDVIGYADDTGTEAYNLALSEKRARVVADYIDAQTDIPHNRIHVKGKGDSVAVGVSEEERELDRRVIINVKGTLINQ